MHEAPAVIKGDKECREVLRLWMDALNAYDAEAMDALMHFPHVRFTGSKVSVYEVAGSNPMDLFQRLKDQDNWYRSYWTKIEVLQAGEEKIHYAVQYDRLRTDETIIGRYDSLYVMVFKDSRWAIQARSSFGP